MKYTINEGYAILNTTNPWKRKQFRTGFWESI